MELREVTKNIQSRGATISDIAAFLKAGSSQNHQHR